MILTDKETEDIIRSHGTGGWQTFEDMVRFARAIEDKIIPRIQQLEAELVALQGEQNMRRMAEESNAKLRTENEALRKDAGLYRVLRDSQYQLHEDDPCVSDSFFNSYYGDDLDAAVYALKSRFDAARGVK